MSAPHEPMPEAAPASAAGGTMGLRDLVFFCLVTGISLRWIPTAAAAGPSSLVVWAFGLACFYLPLAFTVVELTSRFPADGGMYLWSRETLGDAAAFQTGWLYWVCNIPYFPAVLYWTAGNALYIGGERWMHLAQSPVYFIVFSLAGLALGAVMNVVGLGIGKWLQNIGGIGTWTPVFLLLVLAGIALATRGSATDFAHASYAPDLGLRQMGTWSTLVFAFGGSEALSLMTGQIRDVRRTLPRGLMIAGVIVAISYIGGTVAMLVLLAPSEISGLSGLMQAITLGTQRLGATWLAPVFALLITLSNLGAVGAWLISTARLPFVCGLDGYLPPVLAKVHPKWGTPYVALAAMCFFAVLFIFLGQAGTSVKGAYDVLVSMTTITYFMPYLYAFASLIKAQAQPAGPEVRRVPGGPRVAVTAAVIGFVTTCLVIVAGTLPPPDEPNKALAVLKILGLTGLMIAMGYGVYALGRSRAAAFAARRAVASG